MFTAKELLTPRPGRGALLTLILVLTGLSSVSHAETDVQCQWVQLQVKQQLEKKFTAADKKGLAERRKRLKELFGGASRSCAKTLEGLLSTKQKNSELSRLFHNKLAAPTRIQLLGLLDTGFWPKSKPKAAAASSVDKLIDGDGQCRQYQDGLMALLKKKLTRTDKKGIQERRDRLYLKFGFAPSLSCAEALRDSLARRNGNSEITELFYTRLAGPTRKDLLGLLDESIKHGHEDPCWFEIDKPGCEEEGDDIWDLVHD